MKDEEVYENVKLWVYKKVKVIFSEINFILLKDLIESEENDHWQDDHRQRVDDLTSLRVV